MPGGIEWLYRKARSVVGTPVRKFRHWRRVQVPAPAPKVPFSALTLENAVANGAIDADSFREEEFAALTHGDFEVAHFVDVAEHGAPPADLAFAAVVNDKYAPGLEALVLSLLRVYPKMDNTFIVFHDEGLSDFSRLRLSELYSSFEFRARDPQRFAVTMGDGYNHKRVGLLGYLTLEVLETEDYSWIVVLDSDLLVLGDISALWQGDSIKAVPDAGNRPFSFVAESTGRPVINSGVLSFPRSERGPEAAERMHAVLESLDTVTDPALFRFADQKFWNVYLATREVELLPHNYNANKVLLTDHYPQEVGSIKILHMTGPKPWYAFVNDDLLTPGDRKRHVTSRTEFATAFALWNQIYLSDITALRTRQFRQERSSSLAAMAGSAAGRAVTLIGNGPSLNDTDLTAFDGTVKVAFNWFVNAEQFDDVEPDHLILPSHMLFGGWHTPRPELPAAYLDALTGHAHRPTVWVPYYFKNYVESVPELRPYDIEYFLFEKPFKRRIARTGWAPLDLMSPLVDSNTGVLTVGVPLALHLGADSITLVGCDSNYSSAAGSYFYDAEQHASPTTREDDLVRTWEEGGEGPYSYAVVGRELARRGVRWADATIGGKLTTLPHITIDEVRSLASRGES